MVILFSVFDKNGKRSSRSLRETMVFAILVGGSIVFESVFASRVYAVPVLSSVCHFIGSELLDKSEASHERRQRFKVLSVLRLDANDAQSGVPAAVHSCVLSCLPSVLA